MSPASFDVGTDTALLYQYGTDFHNLTVNYPKSCPTSSKLLISAREAFCWALGPLILACVINLVEATSYLKKRESHINILLKTIIVILSPFWLILVCMIGAYEELNKRLGQTTTEGDAEKTILNAKMIEVSTEASLQPILQLYLFLLTLSCQSDVSDVYNTCITVWTIIQVLSFLSSMLSIPRTFTNVYVNNQNEMMSSEATISYFSFLLMGVISRILIFELLAFLSGKKHKLC